MNRNESRELREQRGKIAHEMSELATSGMKTAEDRAKFDAMDAAQAELKERIDRIERAFATNDELRGSGAPPREQPGTGNGDPAAEEQTKKYNEAFRDYLKYGWSERPDRGIRGISDEQRSILSKRRKNVELGIEDMIERRDMGTGGGAPPGAGSSFGAYPGSTTGFFVPIGFVDRVTEALKYYGPMLNGGTGMPTIMDTATGQPLPFPTDNDTTIAGELIGEGQQVTAQDVSLSQIVLGAYKFSSKLVKVSIELLQDSAFDIEAYLVRKLATRMGRALNTYLTTGTGTLQPTGIVTASTAGPAAVGTSGNDGTSAGTNTIGSDDLIELEHSVDILYRNNAKYMMHDLVLKALKKIKDKYGRPLWLPGIAVKEPDTINDHAYAINNDMATLQTQASSPQVVVKSMLFGQLDLYTIRRVRDFSVIRLEERFADYGQVAFLGFTRYDGNLLDAGTRPVKYLTNTY